jgi:hypothetical protein
MSTREPKQGSFVAGCTLIAGIVLLLIGLLVDIVWFFYLSRQLSQTQPDFWFYFFNVLPGLALLTIGFLIPYFLQKRWQRSIAYAISWLVMLSSLIFALSINTAAIVLTFIKEPTSANTPQQMFKQVIRNPIPASVTNLQAVGDTWQGYFLFIRFQASKADINSLIQTEYQSVNCSEILDRFVLPDGYDRFNPAWNPKSSKNQQCYEANAVENQWTDQGMHYLLIDRSSGTVYFHGIGS